MSESAASAYVMGHNDRERRRLSLQAAILNPITGQLFHRAGISPGMRVLDLGCGVGEVSLLAARLVGRGGQVIAIDFDESALTIARRAAHQQGLANITFLQTDLHAFRSEKPFDAVVGRHILIHTPDPLRLVQTAFAILNPGGVAVFQEFDFSLVQAAYPPSPLRERVYALFQDFFGKVLPSNMGGRLFHYFLEAGFSLPDCRAEYPIDGGPGSPFYEWLAESARSILPRAEALGIVRSGEIEIDTLAERLRAEAIALRASSPGPVMVGCFARKP